MPEIFVSPDKEVVESPSVLPSKAPTTEVQKSAFKSHSHNRFSAFNLYPDGINFETKEKEEKVILMLRQHPVVNLKWIVITLLLLTGPSVLAGIGVTSFLPIGYQVILSLVWYLVTTTYAIEGFLGWYFNVYFVTTRRVIDVDFFNLIDKRVSDAEIEKIQDVSYTTKGVLGTTLNFGDVMIQTASEVQEFDFGRVPKPEKVAKILNDLRANVH